MSIATEISRLQAAKAALKSSIEAKGVVVDPGALLSEYPALVDSIPGGGAIAAGVVYDEINSDSEVVKAT